MYIHIILFLGTYSEYDTLLYIISYLWIIFMLLCFDKLVVYYILHYYLK